MENLKLESLDDLLQWHKLSAEFAKRECERSTTKANQFNFVFGEIHERATRDAEINKAVYLHHSKAVSILEKAIVAEGVQQ